MSLILFYLLTSTFVNETNTLKYLSIWWYRQVWWVDWGNIVESLKTLVLFFAVHNSIPSVCSPYPSGLAYIRQFSLSSLHYNSKIKMHLAGHKFQIFAPTLPFLKGFHEHPVKLSCPSTRSQTGLWESWTMNQKTWS